MSDRVTSLLLFHGSVVWVAVLAAFLTVVFVAIERIRRARARRWVRGEASSLDLPTSDRVIRGVLEGGGASTTTARGDARHERAPELWVVTPDGRIPLVGDLHVIAGSTMQADHTGSRCEILPGDEVIVHGTLERAALRDELDYRSDPTAFALRGAPLLVTAKHPVSAVARLSLRAIVLVAVGTGLFGYEVEHSLGQIWRDRCDAKQGHFELAAHDACVLAAATPGNREMPHHLLSLLERTRTGPDLDRRIWLALELGECDAAMRPLEQTRQWRRLATLARRCAAPSREQRALVELGYFHAAAALDLDYGTYRNGDAAVLAQDWAQAATRLEHATAPSGATIEERCRIELFKIWAGDREAGRRLRTLAGRGAPGELACSVELEEISGPAIDVWHRLGTGNTLDQIHAVAAAFDDSATTYWGSLIWTSEHAPKTYGADSTDTVAIQDARVIHRLMRGQIAPALAEAAAIDDYVGHRIGTLDERAPLARQLALFTRTTSPATDLPAGVPTWWHQLAHVFLRAGKPFAANLDSATRSMLVSAQDGDGRALARSIATGDSPLRDFDLLAVLPRVQLGRAELVDAIRWANVDSTRSPWTSATHAFLRHSILELAGDHAAAAPWDEIFHRYDAALSTHRVQLALVLAQQPPL